MKKPLKFRNIYIYILSFLASGFGVLLNFVLARFLGAEHYGRLQFYVALATTIMQFIIIGLNTFLIREAKNNEQKGEVFNKCISVYLCIIVFSLPLIFFILNNYILVDCSTNYMVVLIISIAILMGFNSLITAFFQGKGKFHLTILFENLIPKFILLIISLSFIILGYKNELQDGYLIFYLIIYALVAIPFLFKFFKGLNFGFKKAEIKSIIFFFGVTITYSLGNNLTKVLQGGLYKDDVVLGVISVALSIVSLVRVFTSVLDNMMKPIFSAKKREGDIGGLIECYRFDTRVNSYVSIPLYLFFIIHSQKFLSLFGETYTLYPFILVIISLSYAVADLTGPNGTMLSMTGNEKWELINGFIYFGIYISGVFIFSFDRIYGLTISLLIAQIGVNLAKYIETCFLYKKNPLNFKTILSMLIIIMVNGGIVLVFLFVKVNIVLWMIFGVMAGVACVLINFFVASLYRKTDFKTLLSLRV